MLYSTTKETQKLPKEYSTLCDFCSIPYFYQQKGVNKKKNGYPVYILCQHCFDWSLPKNYKDRAKVMVGNVARRKSSGTTFSKDWQTAYKVAQPASKKSSQKKEPEKKGILSAIGYTVAQDVKAAVNIVESSVIGLVSGAADVLST